MNIRPGNYGFTLLELIIVLAVLAILASVAVARFVDLSEKSLQAQEMTIMSGFRTALLLYKAQYDAWPSAGIVSCTLTNNPFTLLENPPPYCCNCNLTEADRVNWSLIGNSITWRISCPHQVVGCRGASCKSNEWFYYSVTSGTHSAGEIKMMDTAGHH